MVATVPAWAQEPSATPAPAPVALTLSDALKRALAANPGIGVSRVDVDAAQAQVGVAFSSILPKINFKGAYTRNDRQVTFGSGKDAVTILPENDWNYRLTLSQPIYAGNRERKALQQARLSVE